MKVETKTVRAFGTEAADARLKPMSAERREVRPNDVEIEVTHCGICHSDLHAAKNDWGASKYPLVPGHEIVGRVTKIGDNVTRFKIGFSFVVLVALLWLVLNHRFKSAHHGEGEDQTNTWELS